MNKKTVLIAIAIVIALFITSCTPSQNRKYALDEFRRAGASQATINKFDCIGYRESRWQADAKHKNRNGTWDLGLFQINSVHQGHFQDVTGKNYWTYATNVTYNVQYTIWLWRNYGFEPWRGYGC